jgi:hypothetical protein
MARHDFPSRVKTQLALRVNHRCSNPDCGAQTSGPRLGSDASVSVGVAAHISAASAGGPRFDPALRPEDRRSAGNGLWLCQNCAKLIDNDQARYQPALLREWKSLAEAEAQRQMGERSVRPGETPVLDSVHGRLERQSNPRFGFSFVAPATWDRQDPANGDGNTFRHPRDPRIEIRAWGGYAVVSPDLDSWVDWTIEALGRGEGFRLLSRTPAGAWLVDWRHRLWREPIEVRRQVEGRRVVFEAVEAGQPMLSMQSFIQFDDVQVSVLCTAPAALFGRYEDLFLVISKEIRVLGPNSAPLARTGGRPSVSALAAAHRAWRRLSRRR